MLGLLSPLATLNVINGDLQYQIVSQRPQWAKMNHLDAAVLLYRSLRPFFLQKEIRNHLEMPQYH